MAILMIAVTVVGCASNAPQASQEAPSSSQTEQGKLIPGIYEATARGFMGNVTVHVTVDETSILSVDVVSSTDRPEVLTKVPIELIPEKIVNAQSTGVDLVSGATFTSSAIINATKDALKQAGNADMFATAVAKPEKTQGDDVTVDVLVIGGGGSGSSAALSAKYADLDGTDSGLSVMLVEKQGLLGGSLVLSGGSAMTAAPINDSSNVDNPELMQELYDTFQAKNSFEINKPLIYNMMKVSGDTITKYHNLGLSLVLAGFDKNPSEYTQVWQRTTPYRNKVETFVESSDEWYWRGVEYSEFFSERFDHAGVDVRLNTKAEELIVENGAVVGARVTGPESIYNVYAKKVILASGGFAQNAELIQKYAAHDTGVIPFANGGSDGDGFIMAEAVDAAVVGDRMMGYLGTDFRFGMWSDLSVTFHRNGGNAIFVNNAGNRFIKDSKGFDIYLLYDKVLEQDGKTAYAIIDADNPAYAATEASTQTDFKWKADTIEELASMIGVPVENLTETVNSFNDSYHAGENDEDFGVSIDNMIPLEKGPFYAIALNPIAIGSLVGLKVTENCEVVDNSGNVVPNLYAVGEMSMGGNLLTTYIGAWGNGYALYSGRIAGEHAKSLINN